jgi:hypothetical protein
MTEEIINEYTQLLADAINADRFQIVISSKKEDGSIELKQISNGMNLIELNGILELVKQNNFLNDLKMNNRSLLNNTTEGEK